MSDVPDDSRAGDASRPEKLPVQATVPFVRIRTYEVVSDAVERGVAVGYRRAHKHLERGDTPAPDVLRDILEQEVMNALCEVLDFPCDE